MYLPVGAWEPVWGVSMTLGVVSHPRCPLTVSSWGPPNTHGHSWDKPVSAGSTSDKLLSVIWISQQITTETGFLIYATDFMFPVFFFCTLIMGRDESTPSSNVHNKELLSSSPHHSFRCCMEFCTLIKMLAAGPCVRVHDTPGLNGFVKTTFLKMGCLDLPS